MSGETNEAVMPQIQRYLDVKDFLKDVYEWRKKTTPGFSYSQWADELGFRSRSFVRLVVVGKRSITELSIPRFVRGLALKRADAAYFEKLVRFNQAGSVANRERYGRELMESVRGTFNASEIKDHYLFLSSPLGPRLQTLLTLKDVERTTAKLAWLLGATESETASLLESLERMGLARRDGEQWTASVSSFEVKEKLGDVALQSFHRKSLEESVRAIDLPAESRRFQAAVMPLSEGEFGALNAEVIEFLKSTLAKYTRTEEGGGRRVYQLNLGLIPVSKPLLRDEKSRRAPVGEIRNEERIVENPL